MVDWPTTPREWCAWYKRLDKEYDTSVDSPLHHDSRCPLCTEHVPFVGRRLKITRQNRPNT